jgi:hypothetical protein
MGLVMSFKKLNLIFTLEEIVLPANQRTECLLQ